MNRTLHTTLALALGLGLATAAVTLPPAQAQAQSWQPPPQLRPTARYPHRGRPWVRAPRRHRRVARYRPPFVHIARRPRIWFPRPPVLLPPNIVVVPAPPAARLRVPPPPPAEDDGAAPRAYDDAPAPAYDDAPAPAYDDAPAPAYDDAPAPGYDDAGEDLATKTPGGAVDEARRGPETCPAEAAQDAPGPDLGEGPPEPGVPAAPAADAPPAGDLAEAPAAEDEGPLSDAEAQQLAAAILAGINAERARHGLAALVDDGRLGAAAWLHSEEMYVRGYFSHRSPTKGSESFVDRLRNAGVRQHGAAGENIAMASWSDDIAARFVQMWLDSPGHRANILSRDFRFTGVGVYGDGQTLYATQVFAAQARTKGSRVP